MAYWVLPAFLLSIGAGPALLGIIEGVAESVASFGKLFSGYLADRFELRKPLVTGGYAVSNIAKPLLALATRWWQVLGVRFADRGAKGLRGTARDVMLAESTRAGAMGGAFGLLQAMDSAGAILGPLVALLLLARVGFRTLFWMAGIPGLAAVLVIWLGARETHRTAEKESKRGSLEHKRVSFAEFLHGGAALPRGFYILVLAVTLFSLGNSSDMFLVLRAHTAGLTARQAPLFGLVFNVVYTAAAWPAGKLSDRTSKRSLAALGYLIFAAVYFCFAAAPSRAALWAAMAGYGIYYALTDPVLRALVAESVAPESRGRAFGIYFFSTSLATLAASLLAGQLWKHLGPGVPFVVSAALALVAAVMLVVRPAADNSPA